MPSPDPTKLRATVKAAAARTYRPARIVGAPDLQLGQRHEALLDVQAYLRRYGYLSGEQGASGELDGTTSQALIKFQNQFGLAATGALDRSTRAAMGASRCGLPDLTDPLGFSTIGSWARRNLSFAFGAASSQIGMAIAQAAVRRAFATWSAATDLTFTEVTATASPDIHIEWRVAADPDHSMVGGVLAHADFPPGFSIVVAAPPLPVHYDDQEHRWVDGAEADSFDIETVALHEIGHCLGLLHSGVVGSVMFPRVRSNFTLRALQPDDIAGIRDLYPPLVRFPEWRQLDNNPATTRIVASDGDLYQQHRNGSIWHYTGTPLTGWLQLDNNPASIQLAASDGQLNQLHRNGSIWRYTGTPLTGWLLLDNNPAAIQIVASGSELYQLHRNGSIWRYTGTPLTGWLLLDNNPAAVQIAAGGGELYQLHRNGDIWRYTGTPITGWLQLDNNAASSQLMAADRDLYQLHNNGHIWQYTGTPLSGWRLLDNNPSTAQIVAAESALYQLHRNGSIWRYDGVPITGWKQLDDNRAAVQLAAAGGHLYQLHETGSIWMFVG